MGEIPFPGWDPVFFDIPGLPIDLRYYGLMYVVGFICGHFILVRLARRGFLPIAEERVGDLIFYLILGVILGGRLGYSLFYQPKIFSEPFEIFKVWQGGLSFHGGLLGVVFAFILFSRKHGVPGFRLGDCMTLAVCPGIFAVRMANFINGELYGRIIPEQKADSVPWAMRFPTDPEALHRLGLLGQPGKPVSKRELELGILKAYEDGTWEKIKPQVPLRHPSQLYEAFAEGLLLGLIMWITYRLTRHKGMGTGVFMGIFLIGYGGMRFVIEYFRQPDNIPGLVLMGLSRGQQLCTLMVAIGLVLLVVRRGKRLPPEFERQGGEKGEAGGEDGGASASAGSDPVGASA